ncbi:hypothetical protein [Nonomuraea wenchangensis]|uniref:hypothetical protein n=1 Tax=Nonomuraea wenchangensis TaxID=568860 RepID=UPI00378C690A
MEPISMAITAWKVGAALKDYASSKTVRLTIQNPTRSRAVISLCIGDPESAVAGGWIEMDPGNVWASEIAIARFSPTTLLFWGLAPDILGGRWQGDQPFYTLAGSNFIIEQARGASPKLVSGNGKMQQVRGLREEISDDHTIVLGGD